MVNTISGTINTTVTLALPSEIETLIDATGLLTYGLFGDSSQTWTVTNAGTVVGPTYAGLRLGSGGTVTNLATGQIQSSIYTGVQIDGGPGLVDNAGTVTASNVGVSLGSGGTVTNRAGGLIESQAYEAVRITGFPGTVDNAGTIAGYLSGVSLDLGGRVNNQATGRIVGETGVDAYGAATITNAGRIEGDTILAGTGILLRAGGGVTNAAGGTIRGVIAILTGPETVDIDNAGLIEGVSAFGPGVGMVLSDGGSITNRVGGTITGADFGIASGPTGASTISNAGLIQGSDDCGCGVGISLYGNDQVTNEAGGTIAGTGVGLASYYGSATVVNRGVIAGTGTYFGSYGILSQAQARITNEAGGVISGYVGIGLFGGGVTLRNAGTIIGNDGTAAIFTYGEPNRLIIDAGAVFDGIVDGGNEPTDLALSTIELTSAASAGTLSGLGTQFINFSQVVVNADAEWTLAGPNKLATEGILVNFGTLTNTGTLIANTSTVVSVGDLINDGLIRLIPSVMTTNDLLGSGQVRINGGSILETAGTVAQSQTIVFGAGDALLRIAPTGFGGLLSNFFAGDTIDLSGVTDVVSASIVSAGTLFVDRSVGPDISLRLDPAIDYSGATFSVGNDGDSDFLTTDLACFTAGTRIDTPRGPVAVEALAPGDPVLTAGGQARAVRWIGWRRLDLRRHPDPAVAQPIRVQADAIAPGIPRRDTLLSPEHALALAGGLIPVRLLVNGATIRPDEACRMVTYYHVELDRHDLLLAEGMAAESYLDTGNRGIFANAPAPMVLHPDLSGRNDQDRRVARSCLPLRTGPEEVWPAWRALADRAAALGWDVVPPATTDDPDLRVLVEGRLLPPVSVRDGVYVFALPARGHGVVRLRSRASAPNSLRPWISDRRRLGVAVRRLTLRQGGAEQVMPPDHPALADGWWGVERDATTLWRWTDGDAALALPFGGAALLEVRIAAPPLYLAPAA